MPFDAVARDLDLVALEERVLERWRRNDVFRESLRRREGAPQWVFYEGPPTANGRPGIHHVWGRIFKDLYPRFQTMRGRYVARKGGWDCHGLPVELEVEKELGFTGKRDIEDFGIAEFNQRCRDSVYRYVEDWSALTTRIGMWIDTEDAYWTLDNGYIESVWWLLKQMWDKELIYEGFKVVPYCGRCGTALSSHEVALGYEDVTEASVYVRFPVVDADFDLLVWTTTPWTLLSNVAAAVGPDIDYVRVTTGDGRRDVVLAASLVEAVLGDEARVLEHVDAAELVGLRYQRPFELISVDADVDAFRVVVDDFVTIEEGTGIVHLAPAFGEIDREVGEREGLPVLNPVDNTAHFDATVGPYANRFVKEADPDLIEALRESGRLEKVLDYTHSYPHCWRCGTPLIYWAKPTWFARTSSQVDALLRENETIDWHPEHIKHGRFGDWLANNVDWALSRDRFWGTPLPIWRCTDCMHDICVGSVEELAQLAGDDLTDLDLHRPAVDDITVTCPECNGRARRIEPVLDAWFDSGSMPIAQFHYPFEGEDLVRDRFPADFICEAIDQTRGWFYSLLAVNTLVFDRAPYRHVVCHAHIVDRDGQKMSKSRGNVLDPWSILNKRGADALRWYLVSSGSPWTSRRVYDEGIEESTRRFLLTLWNTYSFFVTYANLDGWEPAQADRPTHVLDRWARSRLHSTVRQATAALESYDALDAAQAIERLVDDLSNWYVRRGRSRFWKSTDPAAHATLYECLVTIAQLLAPFCPFVADELFRNLARTDDSVHLGDWPAADEDAIDQTLEDATARARQVVTIGRLVRNEAKLKVRQPLPQALLVLPDDQKLSQELIDEVADELNVKQIALVEGIEGLLDEHVVPNFRRLGPKAGKHMPAVKDLLAEADAAALRAAFESEGKYELQLADGSALWLEADDVEIRASAHQELAFAREGAVAVALDTRIDDALRREGVARELVRAINDLRRAKGFELSDRVRIAIYANGMASEAVHEHTDWISGEVLAVALDLEEASDAPDDADSLDLDVGRVALRVERV
jgi:isoleucyl-tRNA synthetase